MSSCKRAVRVPLAICVALSMSIASQLAVAAPDVITVPWRPNAPNIPASAYQGKTTTFKAIVRGGTYPVTVTWDFDDGSAPTVLTINSDAQARNASATHLYVSAADRLYNATVTATDATGTDMETYPVLYDASVPADPYTAEQAGDSRSLQIMRNIAASDGLWYLHTLMTGHVGTNNQMTGFISGSGANIVATNAGLIWAMGINGHFVAFPPGTYVPNGGLPDEAANDARWNSNPYSEDILRALNWLLVNRTQIVSGLSAQEESNLHQFPEVDGTPIAGSDDGLGMFIGRGGMYTYEQGHALSALARAELAGMVSQVGAANVIGEPFEKLVQQMVDGLIFGQVDAANLKEGGWYYNGNNQTGHVDLSTTLWGVTGLWHAERFMGDQGIIVNNFAKARMLKYTAANSHSFPFDVLQAGERCGGYRGKETPDPCSLMIGLSHTLLLNYLGANTFDTTDASVLFPAAYAGWTTHTRGELRTMLNEFNAFNGRMFWQFTQGVGWNRQLFGSTAGDPYNRTDRRGNHYGMLHFKAGAQSAEPLQTLYGPHNWEQQFTVYHVKNQFATGMMQPIYNFNGTSTDSACGAPLNTIHAILTFIPDSIPPLDVSATANPITADEGDPIDFMGSVNDPGTGTITWTWDFKSGDTRTGQNVTYSFPTSGVFNVELTAENVGGSDTGNVVVTIYNIPPTIDAGPDLATTEGAALAFSVSVTDPGTGDIHLYDWDFGDGNSANSQNPTHTFADEGTGTYAVSVRVNDGDATVTDTLNVTVTNVAPAPDAGGDIVVDEGTEIAFPLAINDPGTADTHTFAWDLGDGNTSTDQNPSHTYANDGVYTVGVTVTDNDGDAGNDSLSVTVNNVAPVITSTPPGTAPEGVPYTYTLTFTDPGPNDSPTCSLVTGPATMTLAGCTITWPVDLATAAAGPVSVEMCVTDDDTTTCQQFTVTPTFLDADADGLPDTWENDNFGHTDFDQFQDPDNDGLNNAQELAGGTNPGVFDGPEVPTIVGPACDSEITTNMATLTVGNAVDPSGDTLTYEFRIYSDPILSLLVDSASGVAEDASGQTSWSSTAALSENTWYFWVARATDPFVNGPWTAVCRVFVNVANEPSSPPRINSPAIGSQTNQTLPTLVVDNAVDPDEDTLTYEYEVYSSSSLDPSALVETVSGVAEGSATTGWTMTVTLAEDSWYWWRARATGDDLLSSEWSEVGRFYVSAENSPPGPPTIVNPQGNIVVNTVNPALVIVHAHDVDGDALSYDFQIATDENFSELFDGIEEVQPGAGTSSSWTSLVDLSEDVRYCWRSRAFDGAAYSDWVSACFVVSATNGPPTAPTLLNPGSDSVVPTVTPGFTWAASSDPEGEALTYRIELLDAQDSVVEFEANLSGTTTVLNVVLTHNLVYKWRVKAIDPSGAESDWSEVNEFRVISSDGGGDVIVNGSSCSANAGAAGFGFLGLVFVAGFLGLRRRRTVM